ncbi:unnamed protein product [Allacma fusca]|uniref:Mediator of RNA polymerase II transcription subunit 6 n=1 Tax=Allacma fusca TaxID=39272 RepID=A0A8J2NPY9_9HEXA|nr:unnamed protein product [Allacma fusca]
MQRLSPEQLNNMTGLEYMLLHVQEPILYVIRKQHRHSTTHVTPISDFYIIAGVVYQAPDLGSVVNSRLLSTLNHLQSAFDEVLSFGRYHPSKGYTWEFKDKEVVNKLEKKKEKKEEPSSLFQRQRVDILLVELTKKFPLRVIQPQLEAPTSNKPATPAGNDDVKPDPSSITIKTEHNNPATPSGQEKMDTGSANVSSAPNLPNSASNSMQQNPQRMKPPPEKRPRLS